jgi:hypothetical protein
MTTEVCPRCGKRLQVVLEARLCVDRIHCLFSDLDHRHLQILRDAFELIEAA